MTPALRSAAIEAMARAKWELYAGLNFIPAGWPREWDQLSDFMKAGPLRDSTIELDALRRLLDERGCVVAPRVATEGMKGALGLTVERVMFEEDTPVIFDAMQDVWAAGIAALTAGGDGLGEG